jgi:hypothetical protein
MKKLILFVAVMMVVNYGWAQNWQCVQANVLRHYNGIFVRGMKIDSFQTINNDQVFYPFHTPRGAYIASMGINQLDTMGGSWLGKKIILKQDGTMMFDTYWGDTVFINTRANVGDAWIFYNDTSSRYYMATVVSVDTATLLNVLDSVKTISIAAYNNGSVNASDIAHNLTIVLSKNHGFAKTFSVYAFPFHPDSISTYQPHKDFILDRREIVNGVVQSYTLFNLQQPSLLSLTDYNVGDVFEYNGSSNTGSNIYWKLDSVMTKTQIGPNNYSYTIAEHVKTYNSQSFVYTNSSVTSLPLNGFTIDTNNVQDNDLGVYPNDSSYCYRSTFYGISDGLWHDLDFEPCYQVRSYKEGMSQISESICTDPAGVGFWWELIYTKKNGVSCGTYVQVTVGINDANIESLTISPNPTTGQVNIKGIVQPTVAVYNLMGQRVVLSQGNNEVSLAQLPSGMYLVQVFNKDMQPMKSEQIRKE